MKVTKHYEGGYVVVYIEGKEINTCITFYSDRQVGILGECLKDLDRTGGREVFIKEE